MYFCNYTEMKKLIKFLTALILTIILVGCLPKKDLGRQPQVLDKAISTSEIDKLSQVNVVLDSDDGQVATFSGISAKTAFEALEKAAQFQNIDIKTKQYDFGIFVEAINDKENTSEKSWLYYVNGKIADKAADKYEIQDGDIIEWRYEKPQF